MRTTSMMAKRGLHASSPARMKVVVPVKRVVDYAVKVRGAGEKPCVFFPRLLRWRLTGAVRKAGRRLARGRNLCCPWCD
jgi:hypothetical protein